MQRTASHVLAAANAPQLEMRILANYGADPRFAFLRGRWPRAWARAKAAARRERAAREHAPALSGLVGYDGSGEEDEESGADAAEGGGAAVRGAVVDDAVGEKSADGESADDPVKVARRARAREWAEKRRAMKAGRAETLAEDA